VTSATSVVNNGRPRRPQGGRRTAQTPSRDRARRRVGVQLGCPDGWPLETRKSHFFLPRRTCPESTDLTPVHVLPLGTKSHRVNALIIAALLLGATACAGMRPVPLPVQAPESQRATVKTGTQRCSSGRCRTTMRVGGEQLVATTRTRVVRAAEAAGEKESMITRAGDAAFSWLLRQKGIGTERDFVGLGSRDIVFAADSVTRMRCDVRWDFLEHTEPVRDGGDITTRRVSERVDCDAQLARTPGVRWRFSRGTPIPDDSTAPVRAPTAADPRYPPLFTLPMRLTREEGPDAAVTTYDITLDPVVTELFQVQMTIWRVRRPDGTFVGTLFWRYWRDASVLEIANAATPDEQAVLRLAAVAVLLPLESTR